MRPLPGSTLATMPDSGLAFAALRGNHRDRELAAAERLSRQSRVSEHLLRS